MHVRQSHLSASCRHAIRFVHQSRITSQGGSTSRNFSLDIFTTPRHSDISRRPPERSYLAQARCSSSTGRTTPSRIWTCTSRSHGERRLANIYSKRDTALLLVVLRVPSSLMPSIKNVSPLIMACTGTSKASLLSLPSRSIPKTATNFKSKSSSLFAHPWK